MNKDPNAPLSFGEQTDLTALGRELDWNIEHFEFLVAHPMAARAVLAENEVRADREYERQREEGATPDA